MRVLCIFFIFFLILFASTESVGQRKSNIRNIPALGLEVDILPYITGGYYGSIWYGIGQVRGRFVVANVNVPSFYIPSGFKDNNIYAYALLVDYFIRSNDFSKFWIGVGPEYWDASITSESTGSTAYYSNYIISVGLGYSWKFYRNFYLNPWLAFHILAAGDSHVDVDGEDFKPPTVTPEISLKIGWYLSFGKNSKRYLKSK